MDVTAFFFSVLYKSQLKISGSDKGALRVCQYSLGFGNDVCPVRSTHFQCPTLCLEVVLNP